MTREETKKIMAALRVSYPMYYQGLGREDLSNAVNLWTEMFADDSAHDVAAAVKAYMATDTKGFPPSIGQIKEKIRTVGAEKYLTDTAAWAMVRKAITDGIYHSQEHFKKLSPEIRECVTPDLLREWAMDESASEQVIASNFMRSYRQAVERHKEFDALPTDIKNLIEDKALNALNSQKVRQRKSVETKRSDKAGKRTDVASDGVAVR